MELEVVLVNLAGAGHDYCLSFLGIAKHVVEQAAVPFVSSLDCRLILGLALLTEAFRDCGPWQAFPVLRELLPELFGCSLSIPYNKLLDGQSVSESRHIPLAEPRTLQSTNCFLITSHFLFFEYVNTAGQ